MSSRILWSLIAIGDFICILVCIVGNYEFEKIIPNSRVQLCYCPTRPISIPIASCHGYVSLSSSSITFSSGPMNISILVPADG